MGADHRWQYEAFLGCNSVYMYYIFFHLFLSRLWDFQNQSSFKLQKNRSTTALSQQAPTLPILARIP